MNPCLDARLSTALNFICAQTHADIGTDHAKLPVALIASGRCQHVIGIELNAGPLAVARAEVQRAGYPRQISLRQGDGFAPLKDGEVQSASCTGLGGRTIRQMLERAHCLPPTLVLQPNAEAQALRRWALGNGYHLSAEALAPGFWRYAVLQLQRRAGTDPVYQGLPREAALQFGPHLLRSADVQLQAELHAQHKRLSSLAKHGKPAVLGGLALVETALAALGSPSSERQDSKA